MRRRPRDAGVCTKQPIGEGQSGRPRAARESGGGARPARADLQAADALAVALRGRGGCGARRRRCGVGHVGALARRAQLLAHLCGLPVQRRCMSHTPALVSTLRFDARACACVCARPRVFTCKLGGAVAFTSSAAGGGQQRSPRMLKDLLRRYVAGKGGEGVVVSSQPYMSTRKHAPPQAQRTARPRRVSPPRPPPRAARRARPRARPRRPPPRRPPGCRRPARRPCARPPRPPPRPPRRARSRPRRARPQAQPPRPAACARAPVHFLTPCQPACTAATSPCPAATSPCPVA